MIQWFVIIMYVKISSKLRASDSEQRLRGVTLVFHVIGGSRGACAGHAPYGTQFFHFHIHFHQKVPTSEVHAPPNRCTPPYGKSWIHHCMCISLHLRNAFHLQPDLEHNLHKNLLHLSLHLFILKVSRTFKSSQSCISLINTPVAHLTPAMI